MLASLNSYYNNGLELQIFSQLPTKFMKFHFTHPDSVTVTLAVKVHTCTWTWQAHTHTQICTPCLVIFISWDSLRFYGSRLWFLVLWNIFLIHRNIHQNNTCLTVQLTLFWCWSSQKSLELAWLSSWMIIRMIVICGWPQIGFLKECCYKKNYLKYSLWVFPELNI